MKKILFIFLCGFISFHANCGTVPAWAWGHTFNANISAMEYAGNYIYTAGSFSNGSFVFGNANIVNQGGKDVVIMKWDTLGNLIWATSIWGNGDDSVVSIKVNAGNELIVAGSSNSSSINAAGNVLVSNGGYDIYTARYDLNGNAQGANIYGTASDEYVIDMCTDYQSNIYIASVAMLTKYNNSGVQMWQKSITATVLNEITKLSYSAFDSTVVMCGYFAGIFNVNNLSVSSIYTNAYKTDIYIVKLATDGVPVWLNKYRAQFYYHNAFHPNMYVNNITGKIYVPYQQASLGDNHYLFFEALPDGTYVTNVWGGLPTPTGWDPYYGVRAFSIQGNSNYVSVYTDDIPDEGFLIYDVNTHTLIKKYNLRAGFEFWDRKSPHIFQGLNSIYTQGQSLNNNHKIGKISPDSLVDTPTFQTIHVCSGTTDTLNGNIAGGTGPLTYSWLPVTGLNNTNTNTVIYTATNNITYTLTVTDSLGNIAKDTFNIIIDTPIAPVPNITSQYPAFCDSMQLYANNGIAGNWYQFMPLNLPYYQWQLFGTDTTVTIYSAGTYKYTKSNACNSVADTITIAGTFTVTASATSDTVCSGQSVTLNGNGAVNYVWTGGVQNNTPFAALNTQTYIVTGTDGNGCSNTSYITIVVNPTYTGTATIAICANQTPYSWNGQTLDSTGTYTANYTTVYGCDSTELLNLTVSPCIVCVPNITINYTPFYNSLTESQSWITTSGTVLVLAGTTVKLDANSTSYVRLNPGFKAEHGAVFVAQAYNGCTAGAPQLPQLGKIMPDLQASNEIVLYPNPTTGMIHIKHDEKLAGIQMFDMVGKLIINQKCEGEQETNIDLSNLPNGVYHVKATGYNSIKIIKHN